MAVVLLGLGTNIGDREENLRAALRGLSRAMEVLATSAVYETSAMYVTDQPAFLNMAAKLRTDMPPTTLLETLKALESEIGRRPGVRFGPRVIDLDILFYGPSRIDLPHLTVPHPRLDERAFALVPLHDIAPDWRHPDSGRSVAQLLESLKDKSGITPKYQKIDWTLSNGT